MSDYMKGLNVGLEAIDLSLSPPLNPAIELRPTGLIRKEDGALGDKPSYCMILIGQNGQHYYAQMSEATLNDAIEESKILRKSNKNPTK